MPSQAFNDTIFHLLIVCRDINQQLSQVLTQGTSEEIRNKLLLEFSQYIKGY